jgi:hypothetical protein
MPGQRGSAAPDGDGLRVHGLPGLSTDRGILSS